ncbi:MAG: hypothetical protein OEO23_00680, partial [Gemmatimonadota bacterium]|nr:hypothetical protein [Gemmatimonadota bacterium]
MDSRHRSQTPAHSLILTACASAAALVAAACGDSPTSEDGGGLCDRLLVEDSIQAIVQQGEAGWF